jgi:hypothetical protein
MKPMKRVESSIITIVSTSMYLLLIFGMQFTAALAKSDAIVYTHCGDINDVEASFILHVQFNVHSIDLKTETLFSSYYFISLWTSQNISEFSGAIFKSDKHGPHAFISGPIEDTHGQRFLDKIVTDPSEVSPWEWELHPIRPCVLGSPFDRYELVILLAVRRSVDLALNDTLFVMPASMRGDWEWKENSERLTGIPSNETLQQHGINPEDFAKYKGEEMIDFFLYTVTLVSPSIYSWRISIAYLIPSLGILVVLILSSFRFNKMRRSDFLTLYLGTAFFILPFLVSFYQYAPPKVFTIQEVFFYFDFVFVTFLVAFAIINKSDSNNEKGEVIKKAVKNKGSKKTNKLEIIKLSESGWLKEYYTRISEECRFSMNRKDTLTYWAITAVFVMLAAYVELLRFELPSIWRIGLLVGTICLIARFFMHSCLAYSYLRKWRFLLEQIENHWMTGKPLLEEIQENVKKYHHTPRTTVARGYLVKAQLRAGFLLVFLLPSLLISFEILSFPQSCYAFVLLGTLFMYLAYESWQFISYEHMRKV